MIHEDRGELGPRREERSGAESRSDPKVLGRLGGYGAAQRAPHAHTNIQQHISTPSTRNLVAAAVR
eukprot:8871456-Heterocapsa_arctica.AAC.1